MSPIQKIVFLTGLLVSVSLAATLAGILLQRAFPENPWVTIIGPMSAAVTVLVLAQSLRRR